MVNAVQKGRVSGMAEQDPEDALQRVQAVFEYLEKLRESGATNMYGAAPYIQREFGMTAQAAHKHLARWMDSYAEWESNRATD